MSGKPSLETSAYLMTYLNENVIMILITLIII